MMINNTVILTGYIHEGLVQRSHDQAKVGGKGGSPAHCHVPRHYWAPTALFT